LRETGDGSVSDRFTGHEGHIQKRISTDRNVMIKQKRSAEQLLHPMKGFFLFKA
jgi:hypothetical protein